MDKGLDQKLFTRIPHSLVKKSHHFTEDVIFVSRKGANFVYHEEDEDDPKVAGDEIDTEVEELKRVAATTEDVKALMAANHDWIDSFCNANGYGPDLVVLMHAIVINQYLSGLFDGIGDDGCEAVFLDATVPEAKVPAVDAIFDKIGSQFSNAQLLISASIINHYKINHTTGQGSLQGFMGKVSAMIEVFGSPTSRSQADIARHNERIQPFLYTALHRIGKIAGAIALLDKADGLAIRVPLGQPVVTRLQPDGFVSLRTSGFPAGIAKLPVLANTLKMMASSGMILFAPIAGEVKQLAGALEDARKAPIKYHTGARFYFKYNPLDDYPQINQNDLHYQTLTAYCAVFLHHVAPHSTLARSPQFRDVYETARASISSFDSMCAQYAAQKVAAVSSDKIKMLIAVKSNISAIVSAGEAFDVLDDPERVDEHATATADIDRACQSMVIGL